MAAVGLACVILVSIAIAVPASPEAVAGWVTGRAIHVDVPEAVFSGQPTTLSVTVGRNLPAEGTVRVIETQPHERTVATASLHDGSASIEITPWKADRMVVAVETSAGTVSQELTVLALPTGAVVPAASSLQATRHLPEAAVIYPQGDRPTGPGADAQVQAIPDELWERMRGRSWQPGCPVGRADLRLVSVNHYGFDGYRYRGHVVVSKSVARQTAQALAQLHQNEYPIRQMRLPEEFPLDRLKGVSDYKMMEADNTSGFNCRYVVGRESERALSPHAFGLAIDVNPLENPFKSRTGVVPYRQWVDAPAAHPAVIRSASDPAVKAFTGTGATWGGTFGSFDYHHFEWPKRS